MSMQISNNGARNRARSTAWTLFAPFAIACSGTFGNPVPTTRVPIVVNEASKHIYYRKGDSRYFHDCGENASRAVFGVPAAEALVQRCWSNRNLPFVGVAGVLLESSTFVARRVVASANHLRSNWAGDSVHHRTTRRSQNSESRSYR